MTEQTGKSNTDAQPEQLPAAPAAGAGQLLAGWLRKLGPVAAVGAALYALGYVITVSNLRMLGVGSVELSNEQIVYRAAGFFVLSVVCVVLALRTWGGLALGSALLLVCAAPGTWPLLGRCRARPLRLTYLWVSRGLIHPWVRRSGASAAFIALIAVTLVALIISAVILPQFDQLLQTSPNNGPANADDRATTLLGYHADLKVLLTDDVERRTLYGFLFLAAAFCTTVWLRLWRGLVRHRPTPSVSQRLAKGALVAAGLLVVLQLIQVPMLYGFLVPPNEFPVVRVAGHDARGSGQTDTAPSGQHLDARRDPGSASALQGKLLILGSRGDVVLVYSMKTRELWWVKEDDLLPAVQLPPASPFQQAKPQKEDQ